MFEQYHQLKAGHPDAILFFRMGDFYEMFFDDAEVAAGVLDLTLTARNKNDPDPIPMAGVPHHAAPGYIQRLVDKGFRVAIADQVEDPATAKGLVRREVVRVVTPGVVLDPTQLEHLSHNWLAAVQRTEAGWGIAFLDASTGDLRLTSVPQQAGAVAEVQRLRPREALLGPGVDRAALAPALVGVVVSELDAAAWNPHDANALLCEALGVHDLSGFGVVGAEPGVVSAGAVVRYAMDRLGGKMGNLHHLIRYDTTGFMAIDETTRRNLELTTTVMGGGRRGSVLALMDRAATNMGSRLLKEWLLFPLLDVAPIRGRQASVLALFEDGGLRERLRDALKPVADIERIGARVAQGTAHARDLAGLMRSLAAVPGAISAADGVAALRPHVPTDACADVLAELQRWLVDDPPQSMTEGGLVPRGAHAELDELVAISLDGVSVIAGVEEREREATGIQSLKIRRNRVFGYFIEVTRAHLHRVPDRFLRKQTLSNCERYITAELKELEEKVLGADERRKELEYELFVALRDRVAAHGARLAELARQLAALDALAALAEVAVDRRWVLPTVDDGQRLDIEAGRHPVVEAALTEERFVPNDVCLDPADRQLIVLTGPNMSGKSTTMRQVALIALLAQMGSFVPADRAQIGLCDRIFTRVGASDDLSRGQSTFMVEMAETANILHHATARSLVILDEIGRGTSTYDGLAIAWAVAEDIHDRIRCRTLFATHYHELCELTQTRPRVVNQSVAVTEFQGEIVFLRRLKEGGASRSYGIQCAKLAGLPAAVVQRADRLLTGFERHAPRNEREQLSLFGVAPPAADSEPQRVQPQMVDPCRERLRTVDPDTMSPREAHALLYELHALAAES